MPTFDVTAPNGRVFRVDAPEGATEDQAIAYVADVVYPASLREPVPKPERGLGSLFTQSLAKGFGQTGILLGDYLPAMVGRAVGADEYAQRQLAEARASAEELERKYPTEFRTYEDVKGVGDAVRYGVEALGTGLPSLVPGLVTGGAGALAARGLTSAAGRLAATAGATTVGTGAQTIPEAYATILAETGQERLGPALVAGGVNAALEAILPSSLINRFSGPAREALKASIGRRLGIGFAEGAAMEGLTEGAQEAVNNAAVTFVDANKEFFTSDNWRQIVDSAIRGAIVGGPVSAVTSAAAGRERTPEGEAATPPSDIERVEPAPTEGVGVGTQTPVPEGEGEPGPAGTTAAPAGPEGPAAPEGTAEGTPPATPAAPAGEALQTPAEPAPVAATPVGEPQVTEPAPAQEPAEPAGAVEAPRPTDLPIFELPEPLRQVQIPAFNFRKTLYAPEFVNPVDTALYLTTGRYAADQDTADQSRDFLKKVGFTDTQIQRYGNGLLDHLSEVARPRFDGGVTSGPLPVDFMRTVHGPEYEKIVSGSQLTEAPRPAVPAAPQAPAPTTGPTFASPLPITPEGKLQTPAQFSITSAVQSRMEDAAKGSVRVIRELHSRLYPGLPLQIKETKAFDLYGKMRIASGEPRNPRGSLTLYMNFDKIKREFRDKSPEKFLKTLFHEFAHPIEHVWVSNADAATINAVVDQYIKERNPSSLERAAMMNFLLNNAESLQGDAALDTLLKTTKLTKETYRKFVESTARKAPIGEERGGNIASDYMRSFSEWVAEKGAQWFTKDLEGLIPQTAFERFQKQILDGLRNVYREVSRILGLQPTEGAFEQLLRDVYGKKVLAPAPRFNVFKENNFQNLFNRAVESEGVFSSENLSRAPEPDTTSAEAKRRQAEIDKDPTTITEKMALLTQPEDKSVAGRTRSILNNMFGALPGESLGRAFVRNSVSSMVPFLSSDVEALRNLGTFLENRMSSTGRVMGTLNIGPIGYSRERGVFFKDNALPLLKIFEKVGNKRMPQAQQVAIAQRILAERKAGRDLKFYDADGKEIPLSTAELQKLINDADADILEALKEFDKFNGEIVNFAVDTGLIPRSLGERFKTLMYTPFYRAQDEALQENPNITLGGGIYEAIKDPNSINTFNKKVAGGGPIHGNLYENILRNVNAIVSAGLKNVSYQETANTLTKLRRKGGDTTIGEVFDKPSVGTIQYRVGGADKYLLIHDPAMFAAIASISPKQKDAFVRAVGKYTAILRRGITATPAFQLRNLIRALVETGVKSGMSPFQILTGTVEGMRDTWRQDGAYQEILGTTGFGGFGFGSSFTDQAAYMQRIYRSREEPLNAWNGFLRAFDKLEGIGELTEMGPRIAYYKYLRKSGVSKEEAAWEAVNLVNYHRHGAGEGSIGAAISWLIPLVPFLTARIQGLYRLVETGTRGAPKTLIGNGVAGIPTAIVTRGLMVTAINMAVNMMYGEEDWYKKLSEKERLSNMYVKVGDVVVALPRSFEIGELFGGLPTLAMDNIRKGEGNDFTRGLQEMLFKTFLVEPIPQFAKPIAEVYFNKNMYTGQPIESMTDKNKLVELRYDEYTSSFAKMAAHLTKMVDLSPKEIDALLRGYFGTSATLLLGTVDSLISQGGTRPSGIFGDPQSIGGVVGNLTGVTAILKNETQLNNRFVGDFYKLKEQLTQVVRAMDDAAQKQDIDAVRKYMEETPAARGLYTRFNAVSARLTQVNQQMDFVRDTPSLTPDQKRDQLERLRKIKGDLAQQAVELASRAGVSR
jgi:hypothetical protein